MVEPVDTSFWTIIRPADALEFWTAALTVVTAGLGLIAWRGLKTITLANNQLKLGVDGLQLSRLDMKNRADRESIETAIAQSAIMAERLVPLHAVVLKRLGAKTLFVTNVGQVSFRETEENAKIAGAVAWVSALDRPLQIATIELLNAMEVWAMHFTRRVADERVAYEPCAPVFLQLVITLYACLLTHRRANPQSGPYQNVVQLFETWGSRKQEIQLRELLEGVKRNKGAIGPPIGTDIA